MVEACSCGDDFGDVAGDFVPTHVREADGRGKPVNEAAISISGFFGDLASTPGSGSASHSSFPPQAAPAHEVADVLRVELFLLDLLA